MENILIEIRKFLFILNSIVCTKFQNVQKQQKINRNILYIKNLAYNIH